MGSFLLWLQAGHEDARSGQWREPQSVQGQFIILSGKDGVKETKSSKEGGCSQQDCRGFTDAEYQGQSHKGDCCENE